MAKVVAKYGPTAPAKFDEVLRMDHAVPNFAFGIQFCKIFPAHLNFTF